MELLRNSEMPFADHSRPVAGWLEGLCKSCLIGGQPSDWERTEVSCDSGPLSQPSCEQSSSRGSTNWCCSVEIYKPVVASDKKKINNLHKIHRLVQYCVWTWFFSISLTEGPFQSIYWGHYVPTYPLCVGGGSGGRAPTTCSSLPSSSQIYHSQEWFSLCLCNVSLYFDLKF